MVWIVEREVEGHWCGVPNTGQHKTKRAAEDEMYSLMDRNNHRRYRVSSFADTEPKDALDHKIDAMLGTDIQPNLRDIAEWAERAADAMRHRKAIKFDSLVAEFDHMNNQ